MSTIIFPPLFSSIDRIDVVSNAMELRGFGKNKNITWYMGKKLVQKRLSDDWICGEYLWRSLTIRLQIGSRFWNPFQ